MFILRKFIYSTRELSKVQNLAVCAMMLALRIVLGIIGNATLSFLPLPVVKIVALIFIPVAITGYLYGPVCAGIVAGAGDIISYFLHPTGLGYTPGITLCYVIEGIIYGLCLYKSDLRIRDLIITKLLDLAICTLTLQSLIMKLLFFQEYDFYIILLWRAAVLVPFAILEILIFYYMKPLLKRVNEMSHKKY